MRQQSTSRRARAKTAPPYPHAPLAALINVSKGPKVHAQSALPKFESPQRASSATPETSMSTASAITLLRASDICASLKISRSCWLAKVAAGTAPKPAIKAPRFTRWAATDVMAWVDAQAGQEA